jgi:hypothetical protein
MALAHLPFPFNAPRRLAFRMNRAWVFKLAVTGANGTHRQAGWLGRERAAGRGLLAREIAQTGNWLTLRRIRSALR